MSRLILITIALTSLLGVQPANAIQLSAPQTEYSADSVLQTEEMTIQEHLHYTPTKERHEMQLEGGTKERGDVPVQIIRKDLKVRWQLMPSQKMAMEQSLELADPRQMKQNPSDTSNWNFDESVVGEEVVNGVPVTKYKTIATSTDGKKFGGFTWRTKEGIQVKADLLYKEGNEKRRIAMELQNLKIGKQDPQLFEIPQGYKKLDMAGMMGGMMGGAMGREGMGRPGMGQSREGRGKPDMPVLPEDTPRSPEPPADDRSDMQKAGDMMKKMFGK